MSIQQALNQFHCSTRMRLPLLSFLLYFGFAAVSCTPGQKQSSEPRDASTFFPLALGEQSIHVQLALNNEEWSRGLMFREALPEDHGMLFVFPRPAQRFFHMRNTGIPLDIGYFDGRGRLLEVRRLYPYDESPVASRSRKVRFALEIAQGWFRDNDVAPGTMLDTTQIAAGIRQRGSNPHRFGLP